MRAIQIREFGGPEVLDVVDLPDPATEAPPQLVEVTSAGVNFADTHQSDRAYLNFDSLSASSSSDVIAVAGQRAA